jgi:outer membrane protein assembly factor BamB
LLAAAVAIAASCMSAPGGATPTATQRAAAPPAARPTAPPAARPTSQLSAGSLPDVLTFRGDMARSGAMPGPGPGPNPAVRWTFRGGAPIGSQPVVVAGVVYVVSNDGVLHAVDPTTGTETWRLPLGAESHGGLSVSQAVAVIATDAGPVAVALDRKAIAWRSTHGGPVRGTPAIVDDTVVTASTSGVVTATRLRDGSTRWSRDVGTPVDTSVAAFGDTIVVGESDGVIAALALVDGAERWRRDTNDRARIGTPTIVDGRVYAVSLDGGPAGSHHVLALDLADGRVLWSSSSPGDKSTYSPAVVAGLAVSGSENRSVIAFEVGTGAVAWQSDAPGVIEIVMSETGDAVYAATNGGVAFALDAATGAPRWSVPIHGVPYGVLVTGGLVLVATNVGDLDAIGDAR